MRRHHHHHQPRFGESIDRAGRRQHDGPQGPGDHDEFDPERRGRGRSGGPRAGGGRRGRRPEGFDPEGFGPENFGPEGFGPGGSGPGYPGPDGPDPRGSGPGGPRRGGFGPGGRGRGPFDADGGPGDPRDGGFGPQGGGRGGGRGRRGGPDRRGRGPHRAPRGDVRTAVLLLLAEEPMHGYQLMQTITERTGSRWRPSPGAIYPTISQLEDEGLVATEKSGGRKLASLTEAGHAHVEENSSTWTDPFPAAAQSADDEVIDLRELAHGLLGAVREMARTGSDDQVRQAATLLEETRRGLYTILAGPSAAAPPAGGKTVPEEATADTSTAPSTGPSVQQDSDPGTDPSVRQVSDPDADPSADDPS